MVLRCFKHPIGVSILSQILHWLEAGAALVETGTVWGAQLKNNCSVNSVGRMPFTETLTSKMSHFDAFCIS